MISTSSLFEDEPWWFNEVPCLHRVHDSVLVSGAHTIQKKIGMSISLPSLEKKLSNLVFESENQSKKILLTFDDGHRDILKAIPVIKKFPDIQPVLFITGRQLRGETLPLPLTALYAWCNTHSYNLNDLQKKFGFTRDSLKLLPEIDQRDVLSSVGVDINPTEEEMVSAKDLNTLSENGWLIGYHGSQHCDLRYQDSQLLELSFKDDYKLVNDLGYLPWLAWPEGRWSDSLYSIAKNAGFEFQFGLEVESRVGTKLEVINRVIWK
jgi:hypothetical protein